MTDNRQRAKLAITFVWISTAMTLILGIHSYFEYELLERMRIGDYSMDEANLNDSIGQILGVLTIIVSIINIVIFLNWFARSYANLKKAGIKTLTTHNNAVANWFIPFVSLYKPYQNTKEIWEKYTKKLQLQKGENQPKFSAWWTLWILSTILGQISFRLSLRADTIDEFITSDLISIFSSILEVPLAFLMVSIIKSISDREEKVRQLPEEGEGSFNLVNTDENVLDGSI